MLLQGNKKSSFQLPFFDVTVKHTHKHQNLYWSKKVHTTTASQKKDSICEEGKNTLTFNNQYKHSAAHQSVLYPCIITLWARVASKDGQTECLPTYGIQTPGSGFNRHIAA